MLTLPNVSWRSPVTIDYSQSARFNVEPELTAKVLRQGLDIVEVPIAYTGRTYADGKKIYGRDFLSAVWTLIRFRF